MRTLVISDIHGMLDTLQRLLDEVKYDPAADSLVHVGDLVDRGPDSVGVVRFLHALKAKGVMGNHDEKHVRYAAWELKRGAKKNPVQLREDYAAFNRVLVEEKLTDWMATFPAHIMLDPNTVVVHGGLRPGIPLAEQHEKDMLRVRYVDAEGKPKSLEKDFRKPEGTSYWTSVYDQPEQVIYGHNPASLASPVYTQKTVGIDTGAVFGGHLTALEFFPGQDIHNARVFMLKAKQSYATWHPGED